MNKLWLDVETTGLDATKNGVIQIACIIENEDGGVKSTFNRAIKPFAGCAYTEEAEKVHGKCFNQIQTFEDEKQVLQEFIVWLKYNRNNNKQLQIAGYNSRFDQDFIVEWFKRGNLKFWDYFNYYDIDVFALVKILDIGGFDAKGKYSRKLEVVCKEFDIKIDAHDALSDIKATRKLYKKIMKKYLK